MTAKDAGRLWEELRHRDPEEKAGWIRQLATDPSGESIQVLLDVLEQESWFLRDQAARALATMGEAVVEPLVEYLGSGLWFTRASAAFALGRMGLPRAAAPLVDLLKDPNRTVRDAVWDALVLLCRNELATRELASAFLSLPDRARRYALDGISQRDPDSADRVTRHLGDMSAGAPPASSPGDSDLAWEDVVGGSEEARRIVS